MNCIDKNLYHYIIHEHRREIDMIRIEKYFQKSVINL